MFSVIIPVHNRPAPVKQAIQSVLEQDYDNWECIVVDDASTDNTAQICASIAETDGRIRVFSLEVNRGVSAARNYGLDHASPNADHFLFLDSDDMLAPNAMSTLSQVIEKHDVDLIVFAANQTGLQFDPPYNMVLDRTWIRDRILPQHLNIVRHSSGFLQPFSWNKCYKSSLIREHDIRFDEWRKIWEDNPFVIQCLDNSNSLIIIPDMLYSNCDYQCSDHLSSRIDSQLFFTYIEGYDRNVEQFGKEYSFANDYTPRHYFDVISSLIRTYSEKADEEAYNDLLTKLIRNETMREWADRITPRNLCEKQIADAFRENDVALLVQGYKGLSLLQSEPELHKVSFTEKAKRLIRRLFGENMIKRIKRKLK